MKIINGFLFANQIYNDTNETKPCIINLDLVEAITVKRHREKNIEFIDVDFGGNDSIMIDPGEDINDFFIEFAKHHEKNR